MRNIFTKKTFILIFLGLVLAGCEQMPFAQRSGRYPGTSMPPSTACYALESGVTVTLGPGSLPGDCQLLEGRTYVRLRQELKIVQSKIREGEHFLSTCTSGVSKLRKVGTLPDAREIYWEDTSYQGNDLSDFIFVFKREEGNYYYFDVYIDQTKPIPDFVKNCEETGGLIPVIEGFTLPPQFFSLNQSDCNDFVCLDNSGHLEEYNKHLAEYKDYYAKIVEVDEYPDAALGIIGTITATGTEETKIYNVHYHADTMYLKEKTSTGEDGKVNVYNPTEERPPSPTGKHPTLQLKALKFVSTAEWTWATPECKPVIYLYPEKKAKLSMRLDPDGYLTESQPLYENGWENILAYPDGRIIYQGELFESLHYEAMINKFRTPKEGWVVKKEDLPVFFNKLLPRLGLNKKENKDFQEYWLGRLTASPYFFVGLLSGEEIERIEPVDFSVEPDTFIRVRFYFKDLDEPFKIAPPVLFPVPSRAGFTAVEWGGLYKQPD